MATNREIEADLTEEIRARVPQWMKEAVAGVATERLLKDADILREAVTEYLDRRNRKSRPDGQLGLPLSKDKVAA